MPSAESEAFWRRPFCAVVRSCTVIGDLADRLCRRRFISAYLLASRIRFPALLTAPPTALEIRFSFAEVSAVALFAGAFEGFFVGLESLGGMFIWKTPFRGCGITDGEFAEDVPSR